MSRSWHPGYGNSYSTSQRHPDAGPRARRIAPGAYAFGHRGRQIRFGPIAFWSVVGGLVIMAGWSLATATYFAFREDVLARLIARQAHMQYAYEDRIADLRTQVDRLASRQLLDQEQFEQKLQSLVRRQSVLEARAATLSALPAAAAPPAMKPQRAGIAAEHFPAALPRPAPISDTLILLPPVDREA